MKLLRGSYEAIMNNQRVLLTITCMLSAVLVMSGVNSGESDRSVKSSYELFLASPSLVSWHHFETDIRTGRYDASMPVFRDVLEYHDARLKRDLPNSMALSGIDPKNFVDKQQRRTDSALLSIKVQESIYLWRMLEKLASQDFDEDLMWTSCEITARLSPSKFEIILNEVQRLHPERKRMFRILRSRWIHCR